MEALVELIAKYLGLASDFVTANFDKYYNQLVSMKIGSHILGLVIGIIFLIIGIVIIAKASKSSWYESEDQYLVGITVTVIGAFISGIALYYLICWATAPDIMLVDWLLRRLK